jgi:hypothetical protein
MFIIWQSHYQAHLFKKNIAISHFWKAFGYGCFVAVLSIDMWIVIGFWAAIKTAILGISIRAALFDPILNLFRNEKWWYNGAPNMKNGSLLDRIENKLSPFWIKFLKITYIAIFITLSILLK